MKWCIISSISLKPLIGDDITHILEVQGDKKQKFVFDPSEYIPVYHSFNKKHIAQCIASGDASYNAALIESVLYGTITNKEQKDVLEAQIVLNAGATLFVSGKATSIQEGITKAYAAIHSGAAKKVLETMRES